jgi:hypothetical protein
MTHLLINNSNALKATHYLLELALDAIDEHYRQDAHFWISNLQAALQIYKAHTHQTFSAPLITKDDSYRINQSLQRLSQYANSMVYILSPSAKQELNMYLLPIQAVAA